MYTNFCGNFDLWIVQEVSPEDHKGGDGDWGKGGCQAPIFFGGCPVAECE